MSAPQEDAPLPLAPLIARLREAANGPVRAAISYLLDETAAALASQEAALREFDAACKAMAQFDSQPKGAKRLADAITELEAALRERDAEIARLRGEVAAYSARYSTIRAAALHEAAKVCDDIVYSRDDAGYESEAARECAEGVRALTKQQDAPTERE